jgi:glycosyltransferase involved in cell wall biosynthesis
MSRVDVIVPCYKYGHFLRGCVQSVLAQRGVDVRVLIIDDASPDNTGLVAEELRAEDGRVEVRRHSKNRGNIETYNEGLEWVVAEYSLILSADDELTPGALSRAAQVLDSHPAIGFVYGRIIVHKSGEQWPRIQERGGEPRWCVQEGKEWLKTLCKKMGDGIDSPAVVVRTELQRRLGGFRKDLPYSGDIELWARMALHGSVGFLDAEQAIYRVHGENMHLGRDHVPLWLLRDRFFAFRAAFRSLPKPDPDISKLENLVSRDVAREALWLACLAFDRGMVQAVPVIDLKELAIEAYPNAHALREYRGLNWRMRIGQSAWRILRRLLFWKQRRIRAGNSEL